MTTSKPVKESDRRAGSENEAKIRVGIIRCDTHAVWFSVLMDQHDPMLLCDPPRLKGEAAHGGLKGSIHRYFYAVSSAPGDMTAEAVDGFEITRVWDENREVAQAFAGLFGGRPEVLRSIRAGQ